MGKSYACYRDERGKPCRRGDERNAPSALLDALGRCSAVNENGDLSWSNGFVMFHDEGITSSFVLMDHEDNELTSADTKRLVWRGLAAACKVSPGKPLRPADTLLAIDRVVAAFLREPVKLYVLVTTLSVHALPAKRIDIGECKITALRSRLPKYPWPKVLASAMHRNAFTEHRNGTKYQAIRVSTEGRTIFEGVEKALKAVSLLRALWSLSATFGEAVIRSGPPGRKPIGVIYTGPIHTLHNRDGSAANEEYYWYDPDYHGELELYRKQEEWPRLEGFRRSASRQIRRHSYRDSLEDLLVRYIGVLDQPNPGVAFLQLWAMLEKITDTVGANYDETISRATWIYGPSERRMVKELLGSLRSRRNQLVHAGPGSDNEQIVYLAKRLVEPHLLWLIRNNFRVQSIAEYAEVLRMPYETSELKRRHRRVSWILKLRAIDEESQQAEEACE